MLPFERLRYLARHADDDQELVIEAAECLIDFGDEPELLTVCRRLVTHHPSCGALWWLCARVLGDPDPAAAARDARRLLTNDPTAGRLASLLPFPHDDPIAVLGRADLAAEALTDRPDLDAISIPVRGGRRLPGFGGAGIRRLDPAQAMARAPSHALVEVRAASPTRLLVEGGTDAVLALLPEAELWAVAAVGRVVPDRLFDAIEARTAGDPTTEVLLIGQVTRVAGPAGLDPPERLPARIDCPVAPELLRA